MGAVLSALFIRLPLAPNITNYGIPMPTCMHSVLTNEQVLCKDIIIIGDVHGCLEELQELIRLITLKYGPECLYIFVGDIINKGPKNVETLKFIQQLCNCYVVRGNHEERVIKEWLDLESGRIKKFSKRYAWMSGLSSSDMDYIMQLPYTITIPSESIIVVHAGLSPWKHLFNQQPRHMITMRNMTGIDDLEPQESDCICLGVPWASVWPGPQHIYFGHDARRRLQQYPYATGLDTGCVYGGSLTAVNISQPGTGVISVSAKCIHKVPH